MKVFDWLRKLLPIVGVWPQLLRVERAASELVRVARTDPDIRQRVEDFRREWDAFRVAVGLRGGG